MSTVCSVLVSAVLHMAGFAATFTLLLLKVLCCLVAMCLTAVYDNQESAPLQTAALVTMAIRLGPHARFAVPRYTQTSIDLY